jgi:CMP-N-acetylneuraminic acid synthetase
MKNKNFLGIIPARSGSKGIKRKNLALLDGKALIQYTFEAIEESRLLDKTILSTDDLDIIELGKSFKISIPFIRPDYLASDTALTIDVVLHALDYLEKDENYVPDAVILLQPTSPLRDGNDIDAAISMYIEENKNFGTECLLSVNKPSQHPAECFCIENNHMKFAITSDKGFKGRQTFPDYFFINGAIYISSVRILREKNIFFDPYQRNAFYRMTPYHSIDIDSLFELDVAEGILKTKKIF